MHKLSAETIEDDEFPTFALNMLRAFLLKVMFSDYFLRISGLWMGAFNMLDHRKNAPFLGFIVKWKKKVKKNNKD